MAAVGEDQDMLCGQPLQGVVSVAFETQRDRRSGLAFTGSQYPACVCDSEEHTSLVWRGRRHPRLRRRRLRCLSLGTLIGPEEVRLGRKVPDHLALPDAPLASGTLVSAALPNVTQPERLLRGNHIPQQRACPVRYDQHDHRDLRDSHPRRAAVT